MPTGFPLFFIMVLLGPVATRSAMGDLPWVVGTVVVLLGPIPLLRWSPARGWIARLPTEQKSIVRRLRSLVVDCE
ncbi:MAG: hypothetical protein VX672_03210 [Planctomycetota bacterium]|nr:hypothetical protein [Planctomycetota bacterium]